MARSRMRARSSPPPSSKNVSTTSLPSCCTSSVRAPVVDLPAAQAHVRRLDAMHHGIADQMLDRAGHAVQHRAVDLHRAALDQQARLHLPVSVADWRATRYSRSASASNCTMRACISPRCRPRVSRACAAEVARGAVEAALQVLLHRGHVVHGLGHHPRQFLEPREAVELERVEVLVLLRFGNPRRHLRFRPGFRSRATALRRRPTLSFSSPR